MDEFEQWSEEHGKRMAVKMKEMLRANSHKGGVGAWRDNDIGGLCARVRQEINELERAVACGSSPKTVWEEAADVANMAAMAADAYEHQRKSPAPAEAP